MIDITLTVTVWIIGLMLISINFKSPMLSLLTGVFIAIEALQHTQTDTMLSLLLVGFAVVMIGYAMLYSEYTVGWSSKDESE